ncbi:hypothetical protein [Prevotella ihumii]|uniref:hypothetical protein n=1 Tax=Prevotella ihumii TaxID=1917878 RepID=UPI00192A32AC|nr:hypothetical protein [Prevotella ihumii]
MSDQSDGSDGSDGSDLSDKSDWSDWSDWSEKANKNCPALSTRTMGEPKFNCEGVKHICLGASKLNF